MRTDICYRAAYDFDADPVEFRSGQYIVLPSKARGRVCHRMRLRIAASVVRSQLIRMQLMRLIMYHGDFQLPKEQL
ncbi:MAG: hypothetical protein ACYSTF_09230 [Planctomycetota bacterium]